jgi:hypothetical protein
VAKDVLRNYSKIPSAKLKKDQSLYQRITSEKRMEKTVLLVSLATSADERL